MEPSYVCPAAGSAGRDLAIAFLMNRATASHIVHPGPAGLRG